MADKRRDLSEGRSRKGRMGAASPTADRSWPFPEGEDAYGVVEEDEEQSDKVASYDPPALKVSASPLGSERLAWGI